ncbi:hypothetical protein HOE04_01460 [archaeon]|jgi:hypothetical protein|nr:hypothetical protein [archaeon]
MNEDIITALRNGINRGEHLETSIQVLINSGYNPREVKDASRYVSSGVISSLETKPGEHLLMPEKKRIFNTQAPPTTPQTNSIAQTKQEIQSIKNEIAQKPEPIQKPEIRQLPPIIHPKKKTKKSYWIKEILLMIILVTLLGVLGASILFKDKLIGIFG